MQMIFPAALDTPGTTPRRMNSLAASREHRNWPVRLTSMTLCHWARVISVTAASRCRPALATMMSMVPNSSTMSATIRVTWSSSDTSAWWA